MLLPALLLVLAPTLLPAATVQVSDVLAPCGPTCSRLSEPSAPGAGAGVRPAVGNGGVGPVLAACSVVTGALPPSRAVAKVSRLAESRPATAPAQAPQTTTPAPTEPPATDSPTGTGLERWQATIVAVVAAGAIVWLLGRLRRTGRKG